MHGVVHLTIYVADREFEVSASMVLDRLCEKHPETSHELLTRKLPTWRQQDLFSLAEDVGQGDFVNNKCCQTKLDSIWYGQTTASTSVLTVGASIFLTAFLFCLI